MSLRMRAVMMSMPFDSWVTMQLWGGCNVLSHQRRQSSQLHPPAQPRPNQCPAHSTDLPGCPGSPKSPLSLGRAPFPSLCYLTCLLLPKHTTHTVLLHLSIPPPHVLLPLPTGFPPTPVPASGVPGKG